MNRDMVLPFVPPESYFGDRFSCPRCGQQLKAVHLSVMGKQLCSPSIVSKDSTGICQSLVCKSCETEFIPKWEDGYMTPTPLPLSEFRGFWQAMRQMKDQV